MYSVEHLSIIVALGGGLLSFLSPCVFPLVPSYISFITGISLTDLGAPLLWRNLRKRVMLNSMFFVFGFSLVFIALGTSLSFLGRFLASHQEIIQKAAGLIIIFFGLSITGVFKLSFLMRSKELLPVRVKPPGYMGSAIVGISFGAAWTPCIGPILGSILVLAGSATEMKQGIVLLAAYSLGLAIPFLFAAWVSGSLLNLSQRFGKLLHLIHIAGGILLIIVGLLIFTGYFTVLNSFFVALTPSWLLEKI
ncbi:MAG: cytochrome c biogenesis protein CcdA [Deltaproteobacteria bacterium]|nr:cytochrome c biogenesis protein CcdA [Deltaproteobacteria bacterium]MBW1960128.1 cytochrome c biogenesis protein CcdA [Deltaproteobacteria bacterium]MBW2151376.1 cytochrome c biogenesis protein CcdA [Deltaproteobacteria bacterium]